jgi:CheY-like chemotaxis protein
VLLIDDEAESCAWREILAPICRSFGADLEWALTPDQAVEKLQDYPDAVLLDLHYFNVEEHPDPFEVIAKVRNANPIVPLIIFTTEQEGRYVRDLGKDAFHYFFKEINTVSGANTLKYVESFRQVLRSAIDTSMSVVLRGLIRLLIPVAFDDSNKFDRARNLLEAAATAIWRPEVALCLTTGALMEAKVAIADPNLGAPWSHIENLFRTRSEFVGLRSMLPVIARWQRNYASHYEDRREPNPTIFDAVVYLLVSAQFIADLRAITLGETLTHTSESKRRQMMKALGRICQDIASQVKSPAVLDPQTLAMLSDLEVISENGLRCTLETQFQELQAEGITPFSITGKDPITGEDLTSSTNLLGFWFGSSLSNLPAIDWQRGMHIAPYLLYVCRFLILEKLAQMKV